MRTRTRVPAASVAPAGSVRSAPVDMRVLTSKPFTLVTLPSAGSTRKVGPLALRLGWWAGNHTSAAENS